MEIQYIDRSTGELNIENPPAEGLLKLLYGNPLGRKTLLPLAKRSFISWYYGKQMNKPASVKKIKPFVDKLNIDISEANKKINEFTSFNDFFYRTLKPNARPIGKGLTSPGDGKLLVFPNAGKIHNFFIKGRKFTLTAFFKNSELAKMYANYTLIILRLAPNDYHRFHFPYAGIPTAAKCIKGCYYSVSPYALQSNFTKVFCENKREYCTLKTQDKGDIILAPVGATMVGSIFETYTPNTKVEKGDEMGYFAFGGSTVVMLVSKTAFKIDDDLLANTQNGKETFVRMGESIGN